MLSKHELNELIKSGENERVEFTTSEDKTDKFAQAICAFSNDMCNSNLPGYLIIGVSDKNEIVGIKKNKQFSENIAAIRDTGKILPLPNMTIQNFTFDEKEIIVVEVKPSNLTPISYEGRVWIRVGPRKSTASHEEQNLLIEKSASKITTFDNFPNTNSNLKDISLRLFSDYRFSAVAPEIIEENGRNIEEQLSALRFYNIKYKCPTNAALIAFGINPQQFFAMHYVQFLRLEGATLTDNVSDRLEISGDLRTVIEKTIKKFQAHNMTRLIETNGFRDTNISDYPDQAIKELFHNALMHRDYQISRPISFYMFDDRIEIQNAGGFYGGEDSHLQVSYRNPVIAEIMSNMGFAHRFGSGISKAKKLALENGNAKCSVEYKSNQTVATIYKRTQ